MLTHILACMALSSPVTLTFESPGQLQNALSPHSIKEVESRIASSSIPLTFQYSSSSSENKTIPIRNSGVGNLLKYEVFRSDQLIVYYPETPRVPHHLTIAFNRSNIKGITDVSKEENQALFATIRKIAEIYKSVHITGFVIAQYDRPQQGHLNQYVVEIIPHLPGFNHVKNMPDKVDCNRYVLFRNANISPIVCEIAQEGIKKNVRFWQQVFEQETTPLSAEDILIPCPRQNSHDEEAKKILRQHLIEILQDKGGQTTQLSSLSPVSMPMDIPDSLKTVEVKKCPFCDPVILQKQRVFEYNNVEVIYNIRKGLQPGCTFLVLPKQHKQKVYSLSSQEIDTISLVRKALVEVLKESHPENEVIIYIQDDPAIGQTVFHSHEHVVSVDPGTIALTWTLMSLYPSGNVSDEETFQVTKEFGQKMQQKIKELTDLEEAI